MSSPKQIAANQANAQKSTGPTSVAGRAKVSHNALKTGLTGRTVLLPTDDIAAYQSHLNRIVKTWAPEAEEEKRLTHSLADTLWRLERIPSLEAGIYAIGRRTLADQFADEQDEAVRQAMIEAQVFLTYRRDLNNLSIQESRLRKLYEKDETELKRLIAERKQAEKDRQELEERRWKTAIENYKTAQKHGQAFDPAEIGFEFSTAAIEARIAQRAKQRAINEAFYYNPQAYGYAEAHGKIAA